MGKLIKSISVGVLLGMCMVILPSKAFSQNQAASFTAEIPNAEIPYIIIGNQSYSGYVQVLGDMVSNYEFAWNGGQGTIILQNDDTKAYLNFTIFVDRWVGYDTDGVAYVSVFLKNNDTGEFSGWFELRAQ